MLSHLLIPSPRFVPHLANVARAPGPARAFLRTLTGRVERAFDLPFGQAGNPCRHLGALAYWLFWIVAATGIYVYIGFDTRADGAYASVERLSSNAFPLGSFARSLHRYASDAFVVTVLLHLAREWLLGRYAHFRRFSWITGTLSLWLVFASGIGGFWLVWDTLAQYSLIATTEWLDALPLFGQLTRNFDGGTKVTDRLFSLLIFLHIGIPLMLLAMMWVHLQRLSRPDTNPPRALACGTLAALSVLSIAMPVVSASPADLARAPTRLALDWFYLGVHAFADVAGPTALWAAAIGFTGWLLALSWISREARTRRPEAAIVDLANCNGCARCFADCPYAAVTMQARTDGKRLPRQAVVDPDLCAGCGICAGACPSSTAFRSVTDLVTGIDLPQTPIRTLRATLDEELKRITAAAGPAERSLTAAVLTTAPPPRIVLFGCMVDHGGAEITALADARTATLTMLCAAQLRLSFIEYALRAGADGVLITGCRDGDCAFRLGNRWTEERLAETREPHLRSVVPRERVGVAWTGCGDPMALAAALESFRALLSAVRSSTVPPPKRTEHAHVASR